ncbi:UNVERIFIED_ORG: aspartate carbamoyltransferase catalytic subunit [Rhizobium esperanzae]
MVETENAEDARLMLVLDDLRKQRAALEETMTAKVAEWRQEIANVSAAIRAIEVLMGIRLREESESNSPTKPKAERSYKKKENISKTLREVSRRAMLQAGHPLSRKDILAFALREGVELPPSDPAQFLGRVLWRSREFVRTPAGYWLADHP